MITTMAIKMNPSALNSLIECRSWMLYHFVYGAPVGVAAPPMKPASDGIAEKGTGEGSAAPAKSAKSANQLEYVPFIV